MDEETAVSNIIQRTVDEIKVEESDTNNDFTVGLSERDKQVNNNTHGLEFNCDPDTFIPSTFYRPNES